MRPHFASTFIAALAAITVIDGDTVEQNGTRWRLVGLDAPEIHHARCPAEREQGVLAAAHLITLLREQPAALEPATGRQRDKYGRQLGRLMIGSPGQQKDWAAIAVAEHLAAPWNGKGRRRSFCRRSEP